jgi:hypothetical protein
MSDKQGATQGGPGDARIIEEHHVTGPHGEEEIEGTDDRGRRWYHLRPEPPRRTDFMGFNSTWWMAVGWVLLILVLLFPFPWWW